VRIREDKDADELKNSTHKPSPIHSKSNKMKKNSSTKNDREIVLNRVKVKLTNQDKIYFPKEGITKGDVVEYYQSVADYILPHLKNRPLSLNRFPNGIDADNFYHKDAGENTPK